MKLIICSVTANIITLVSLSLFLFTGYANAYLINGDQESKEQEENQTTISEQEKPEGTVVLKQQDRSQIDIQPPFDLIQQQQGDLNHYLNDGSVFPVLLNNEEHPLLVIENRTSVNKGVMLFLPDWHQQAINPKAINFLRKELPDQGWTTISIQPLKKPNNFPSISISDSERVKQNQESIEKYQEALSQLMTAVIKKAASYSGIIVVVAQGQNATLLSNVFMQEGIKLPTAFVMLSAFSSTSQLAEKTAVALAKINIPVLDLSLKTDSHLIKQQVAQRQTKVNQLFRSGYRQKELFNFDTGYYPKQPLSKEINGWLKANGW